LELHDWLERQAAVLEIRSFTSRPEEPVVTRVLLLKNSWARVSEWTWNLEGDDGFKEQEMMPICLVINI